VHDVESVVAVDPHERLVVARHEGVDVVAAEELFGPVGRDAEGLAQTVHMRE
jgi:hypothetical protein